MISNMFKKTVSDPDLDRHQNGKPQIWIGIKRWQSTSVVDPDPVDPWILDPNRFFPDPGSQTHVFESLVTIFWVKSSIIL